MTTIQLEAITNRSTMESGSPRSRLQTEGRDVATNSATPIAKNLSLDGRLIALAEREINRNRKIGVIANREATIIQGNSHYYSFRLSGNGPLVYARVVPGRRSVLWRNRNSDRTSETIQLPHRPKSPDAARVSEGSRVRLRVIVPGQET
jgi:hypothetical protein